MNRRFVHGLVGFVGYILSPLSWWNDAFVNVPLAYLFSWPFAHFDDRLFLPAFICGYWATNVLGMILLHHGLQGAFGKGKSERWDWRHDLAVSTIYTGLIALLVLAGWLRSPATYLPAR
ncbi:MAG: hypothetical protein A3K19_05325 [Lentisphaerae bacterium RIFOXYB12_FULL_65_16]|nr:MAG: hypothetical protein A3K18_02515 [Lentisphaerae bacterium RIFOXYA12_64_32]OGV84157.1 MAG: hypothetical protein A3K19_05325 [Lentisphaerae bacterium RIFOXYB12_FULL_65_16]